MNISASQKIKTGLFVIAGLLILVAGVFLIGSKQNMFSGTYSIYGTFRNAGGLQEGNNVVFGGVNVGTVERIRILSDTVVRVDMMIKKDMRAFIKKDAQASISSDGLMGDKLLVIAPGSAGAPALSDGDRLATVEPVDFNDVIAKFTNVATNAEIITGSLADMALQIKNGDGSVSRLLYRNDLALGLEGTVNNARSITGSLAGIATQVQSGKGSIGSLVYTDSLSKGLEHTVSSANAALVTVQEAADNFSENMKALQGNFFFKGYFKRKARNASAADTKPESTGNGEADDMTDAELEQLITEATKELNERKEKVNTP